MRSFDRDLRAAQALALNVSKEEPASLEERVASLFDRWSDSIYRYLVSAGADPGEAEEITQEAFFRLFRVLHSGKEIENASAWLFRVAHNLSIDRGRRVTPLSTALPDVAQQAEERQDPRPTPEEAFLDIERRARLDRAVRGLTAMQRNCLNLRAEGFRHREIAEVLGVSLSSVADALRRALTRLTKEPE
jgi:RNA polymerase sigma-70 factor (ECF subfamily)